MNIIIVEKLRKNIFSFNVKNILLAFTMFSVCVVRSYIPYRFLAIDWLVFLPFIFFLKDFIIIFREKEFYKTFIIFIIYFSIFFLYLLLISYIHGPTQNLIKYIYYASFIPISALCGVFCSFVKKETLFSIFLLTSIYFICGLYQLYEGNFSTNSFNSVFKGIISIDQSSYQNETFYLGLFSICLMYFFLFSRSVFKSYMALFFLFGAIFIMSYVGGRTAFLATIIVAVLIFLKEKKQNIYTYLALFSGIVVLAYLVKDSLIFMRIILVWDSLFAPIDLNESLGTLSHFSNDPSSRKALFFQAMLMWGTSWKTFLFGSGMGSFQNMFYQDNFGMYPHNFIADILCSGGVVGIILFVLIFFNPYTVSQLKGVKLENSREKKTLIYFLIYNIIIYLFTGTFVTTYFIFFFFFCIFPNKYTGSSHE